MAKNKNIKHTPSVMPSAKAVHTPIKREHVREKETKSFQQPKHTFNFLNPILQACIVAIITLLTLFTCLDNKFTNWDDPGYVKDNSLIKDISGEGIKNIFSTAIMGNYHPLTILSYAIEYSFQRLEPGIYHLDSLLLHILCTILVFWFTFLLSKNNLASFVTALLFGLHPMHIESVAWIAARKDVLYGSFFIGSCIAYIYYINAKRNKWMQYSYALILFVCSVLSKPVAVSLPITLMAIDYLEKRKFNFVLFLEKIPLLLISIAFGIRSVFDQKDFKALNTLDIHFNFFERIALGAYALLNYLGKAIVPIGLSNFYPYPQQEDGHLPYLYYINILIVLLLIGCIIFLILKTKINKPIIIFGISFFLINIVLLLQFIPVGGAILADRYTYIPYIGLFIIAGYFIGTNIDFIKNKQISSIIVATIGIYITVLGFLSNARCKVWYDTVSLWRDEVEKHTDVPSAYNNLGFEYFNRGNVNMDAATRKLYFDSSELLLKEAIRLQPTFFNPYVSLGEVERTIGNFAVAKNYYYQALHLTNRNGADNLHNAYLGLAIVYCISGQNARNIYSPYQPDIVKATPKLLESAGIAAMNFDSARICFTNALNIKYQFPEAHSNFGNYWDMMGNFDSSVHEYTVAINQNPDMYASFLNRARLYQRHGKFPEALKDFKLAEQVAPEIGEIFYSRSLCYNQMGNTQLARVDLQKAKSLNFNQIDPAYYQKLQAGH